ncbi:MAG: DciA family protein [Armatimonadota bacterium]
MKRENMKQFRDLLDADSDPLGFHHSLKANTILRRWNEMFGEVIGQNSWPELFRDGRLTVATTSSVWLQELSFQKEMLLEKLNEGATEPIFAEIILKQRSRRPKQKLQADPELPKELAKLKFVELDDRTRLKIEHQTESEPDMEKRAFMIERLEMLAKIQLQRKKAGWLKCPICSCYHMGPEVVCHHCQPGKG